MIGFSHKAYFNLQPLTATLFVAGEVEKPDGVTDLDANGACPKGALCVASTVIAGKALFTCHHW